METNDYDEYLREELRDSELAAEYLTAAALSGSQDELMIALRNVVEAHGGVGVLADITDLNRQSMYKMLSEEGNPTLASLMAVLGALGMSLSFTNQAEKEEAA